MAEPSRGCVAAASGTADRPTLARSRTEPSPRAYRPILREAVEVQRPRAGEKQIDLALDIETGDAVIFGDHDRRPQALNNVIGNALKFSKSGDSVTVRAVREGGAAYLRA
jgi:signal transduction histidine kinase